MTINKNKEDKVTPYHKRLVDEFKRLKKEEYRSYQTLIDNQIPLDSNNCQLDDIICNQTKLSLNNPTNITNNNIVNLGCLNGNSFQDIVSVSVGWPAHQIPSNYSSGATGPNFATRTNLVNNLNQVNNETLMETNPTISEGQPSTTSGNVTNMAEHIRATPFQSTVYSTGLTDIYKSYYVGQGYNAVTLSQEGLLWTLWPLSKPQRIKSSLKNQRVDNLIEFATSKSSHYRIGQLGYFFNNVEMGCTIFGGQIPTNYASNHSVGVKPIDDTYIFDDQIYLRGINGVQTLAISLLITTKQMVGIVVVKVSEEIARMINPASGEMGSDRFIYVGYDAWAVINTSTNPRSPMMASTYVTPQSVTGQVTSENYQVIFPPNFPHNVLYKNMQRIIPSVDPIYNTFF